MPEAFPLMPVTVGGPPAPTETPTTAASAHPQSEGGFSTAFGADYRQSPVVTGMMRGYGDLAYGSQTIPQAKAAQVVKAQGLDPAFIPKDGIGYGALQEEIQRQGDLKFRQEQFQRSGGGPGFWTGLGAGVAAGVADPSNLVLGPVAGRVAGLARGAMAVRAAVGAGIAATYQGGMEAGEAHLTGHDEDINSWTMLRDTAFAGALGGITGAAFGPRAPRNAGETNLAANNPGNLRIPGQQAFQSFGSMDEGVAAVDHQLALYRGRGLNTIEQIVSKYAPAKDHNDTAAYIADVSKRSGIDPKAKLTDANMGAVRDAMIVHEQGPGWREKAATFGQRTTDPRDKEVVAQYALKQFASDKPVEVGPLSDTLSALREFDIPERGPSSPIVGDDAARLQARGFDMTQTSPDNPQTVIEPQIQAHLDGMTARAAEVGKTVGSHVAGQAPGAVAQTNLGEEAAEMAARTASVRAQLPEHMIPGFDAAIAASEKAPVAGSLTHDELTKAAMAAAKCAAMKGADLGA